MVLSLDERALLTLMTSSTTWVLPSQAFINTNPEQEVWLLWQLEWHRVAVQLRQQNLVRVAVPANGERGDKVHLPRPAKSRSTAVRVRSVRAAGASLGHMPPGPHTQPFARSCTVPSSHKLTMRLAPGVELAEVEFTFGSSFPQPSGRMMREGYGFNIELPAVLDLLAEIDDGVLKAGDVKGFLLHVVDRMYEPANCYRYEDDEDKLAWCRQDGTCQTCDRHRDAFAESLDVAAERWRRWTLPEQYPYVAGNAKGLHEVGCPVPRRDMPREFSPPAADDTEALRTFAHRKDAYDPYDRPLTDLVPLNYQIPFHAMTAQESRAWMESNTGPKGGQHYHRCERCVPAP